MINTLKPSDCILLTSSVKEIGSNSISGTTTDKDGNITPYASVRLFNQSNCVLSCAILSNKNGEYEFKNIDLTKFTFFVIAHHPQDTYNGVIADNIHGVQDVES